MLKLLGLLLLMAQVCLADPDPAKDAVMLCLDGLETARTAGTVTCDEIDRTVESSPLQNINNLRFDVSSISYEYLVELFDWLKSQKHIPFKYPEDGCYARAHEMSRLLEQKGVISGKVFIEGGLRVETTNSPKGYVEWWYHVAPIVKVKKDGQEKVFVIDPSIFDRPVPVEEWYNIQTKHPEGRTDKTYYTPRFSYQPQSKMHLDNEYTEQDLESTQRIMKQYLEIQNERERDKK